MVWVPWERYNICLHYMLKRCQSGEGCRWYHPPKNEISQLWEYYGPLHEGDVRPDTQQDSRGAPAPERHSKNAPMSLFDRIHGPRLPRPASRGKGPGYNKFAWSHQEQGGLTVRSHCLAQTPRRTEIGVPGQERDGGVLAMGTDPVQDMCRSIAPSDIAHSQVAPQICAEPWLATDGETGFMNLNDQKYSADIPHTSAAEALGSVKLSNYTDVVNDGRFGSRETSRADKHKDEAMSSSWTRRVPPSNPNFQAVTRNRLLDREATPYEQTGYLEQVKSGAFQEVAHLKTEGCDAGHDGQQQRQFWDAQEISSRQGAGCLVPAGEGVINGGGEVGNARISSRPIFGRTARVNQTNRTGERQQQQHIPLPSISPASAYSTTSFSGQRPRMPGIKRESNGEAKVIGPHPSTIRVAAPYHTQAALEKKLQLPSGDVQEKSLHEAREDNIRLQGVTWLDTTRRALQLPVRTFTTACVYYHKFRLAHPLVEYAWADAAAASLLMSCKVEDTLKKSKDILAAAYNVKTAPHDQLGVDDPMFEQPSRAVIALERLVLECSRFDFRSRYPHRVLIKMCKVLPIPDVEGKKLAQVAWAVATDLHRTFAPLKQTSATMAIACLELAAHLQVQAVEDGSLEIRARVLEIDITKWSTTRDEVMETLLDALDLYTHHMTSTILGTKYSLDDFLRVRLTLNKECSESNVPRYTTAPERSADLLSSNGATIRVANGHPTPVSPPQTGIQAQAQPNPSSAWQTVSKENETLRFMLNPQLAADEKAEVQKYFVEEWEEYEEEIEVPVPIPDRQRPDRSDPDMADRVFPSGEADRHGGADERREPQPARRGREDRERERERLKEREREVEKERARLRFRERERRLDDRRYDDRRFDERRGGRYDDRRDRRYDDRR